MNLVVALVVIGGSSALVWSGITDPEGGTWAGIGRFIRGETQEDRAKPAGFLTTVAALTAPSSSGTTGNGGSGQGSTSGTSTGATSGAGHVANNVPVTGSVPTPPPSYVKSVYSLGPVLPHVVKAANEMGPMFAITSIGGYRTSAVDPTGHPAGRALDFMVSDLVRGGGLAAYALANRTRLKVEYVIWRQRINSGDGRGWRPMEDRGSPTANHMDHVHVNFKAA